VVDQVIRAPDDHGKFTLTGRAPNLSSFMVISRFTPVVLVYSPWANVNEHTGGVVSFLKQRIGRAVVVSLPLVEDQNWEVLSNFSN
jgi:hypothetical protein